MSDIIIHAIEDSYPIFPFLFLAYYILEYFEHKKKIISNDVLYKLRKTGPFFAALLGLFPQCGFSIAGVSLYAEGAISIGSLISLFIATSDEAFLILLGYPSEYKMIGLTIILKVIIGCSVGILVDMIYNKKKSIEAVDVANNCCDEGHDSIFKVALYRSLKVLLFIFIVNFLLSGIIHMIGEENLSNIFMQSSLIQPLLAALFGFIPNCASSVILTQLYVSGAIQYGSLLAGLITNAGLGMLILYRNDRKKHDFFIVFIALLLTACLSGYIIEMFF